MKKTKMKVAASVTVYRIADMTDKGRKEFCDWLHKLARDFQSKPKSFTKMFRERYLYTDNIKSQTQRPAGENNGQS